MDRKFWRVIDRDHYVAEACLVDADMQRGKYRQPGTISAEHTTDPKDAFPFADKAVARSVAKALRAAAAAEGENGLHRVVGVTKKAKKTISGWPLS